MIEKILDKFYLKKLKSAIKKRILVFWNIDYKFYEINKKIVLGVKKEQFNDEQWRTILVIGKSDALFYLMNFNLVEKEIKNQMDNYYEELKDKFGG